MSHPYNIEDLEALAGGYLEPSRVADLESHLEDCDECAEELTWLRAELDAFAERDDELEESHLAALWQGVSSRIDDERRAADAPIPITSARRATFKRAAWFGAGFSAAAVAAAVMVFVMRPPAGHNNTKQAAPITAPATTSPVASTDAKRDEARKAIADAEAAYSRAIQSLEAEYVAKRPKLDPQVAASHEATFAKNRALLSEARKQAGDDIEGRMLSLDAYARHVRSLQDAVDAAE